MPPKSVAKSTAKTVSKSAPVKSAPRKKTAKVKAGKKGKQKRPAKQSRYKTVTKRGQEVEAKLKEMVNADMLKHRQQPADKRKELLKNLAPKTKKSLVKSRGKSAKGGAKSILKDLQKTGGKENADSENVNVEITKTLPKEGAAPSMTAKGGVKSLKILLKSNGKENTDSETVTVEITTTLPKEGAPPSKTAAKTSIVSKLRKSGKTTSQALQSTPTSTSENPKSSGSDDTTFEVIKTADVAKGKEKNKMTSTDVPELHKMIKDIVLSTNKIKETLQQRKQNTSAAPEKTPEPLIKENLPPDE